MPANNFGPYFDTLDSIDNHHRRVGYIQRRDNSTDKIISPRSIDKVQFLIFPFGI